jgi:nucleoside-diphosphate-sugar epimerase
MAKNILIVGATGQQGRAVIDAVLQSAAAASFNLLALTRTPEGPAAHKLSEKGVKIVGGDLSNVNAVFSNAQVIAGGPIWGIFVALVCILQNSNDVITKRSL